MRWPLRNQILLPMVVVMFGVLAGVTTLSAYLSVLRTRQQIEGQLRDVARTLAESSFPLTDTVLRQMRGLSGAEYVLADAAGRVLASSDRAGLPQRDLPESIPTDGKEIRLGRPVGVAGQRYFHAVILVKRNAAPVDGARLHMFYPESRYSDAWREAAFPPLGIGALGVALVVVLAVLIAGRVVRPLARLRQQVDQIAAGDFQPVPVANRNDEVRDLALAFNRMALMLADYEEEVRRTEQLRTLGQLGGGIAHQLRNAVTGCRMALDLHRRECPLSDGEESLGVAIRQLTLMEKYIARFLARSRGEHRAPVRVDVADLVQRTLPLVRPAADHVHVRIEYSPPEEPAWVDGDAEDLEQLVLNLVLNAVEAAAGVRDMAFAQERCVEIELRATVGRRLVLEVRDSGPGPDHRLHDRLFEPLVTEKPDGVGLGLYLAHDIARRHGGTIAWRRQEEQTCFIVELPLSEKEVPCVDVARC